MKIVRNVGHLFRKKRRSLNNKKAISPIISVLLLIIVVVSIILIILDWGTLFTQNQTNKVTAFSENKSLSGYLKITDIRDNNLIIANNHNLYDVNIIGYKIRTDDQKHSDYNHLNSLIYLEYPLFLEAKKEINLEILCFPSNEFDLDLYTSNNKYISLEVENDEMISPSSCLDYGLVGHWDFKDIGSLTLSDKSGNGNDGTIHGTTVNEFWAQGNGKGVFDGVDDYVEIPHTSGFSLSSDFTYVLVFNSNDVSLPYQTLIGKKSYWKKGFFISNNDLRGYVGRSISATASRSSTPNLSSNSWVSAVMVNNDEDKLIYLYMNGQEVSSYSSQIAGSGDIIENSYVLRISNTGSGYPFEAFSGLISNVRIYNRALSSQEIEDLYNLTKGRYQ
jgi:hypothetical protein